MIPPTGLAHSCHRTVAFVNKGSLGKIREAPGDSLEVKSVKEGVEGIHCWYAGCPHPKKKPTPQTSVLLSRSICFRQKDGKTIKSSQFKGRNKIKSPSEERGVWYIELNHRLHDHALPNRLFRYATLLRPVHRYFAYVILEVCSWYERKTPTSQVVLTDYYCLLISEPRCRNVKTLEFWASHCVLLLLSCIIDVWDSRFRVGKPSLMASLKFYAWAGEKFEISI